MVSTMAVVNTRPGDERVIAKNAERVYDTLSFANNGKSLLIADPGDASNARLSRSAADNPSAVNRSGLTEGLSR